MRPQKYGLLFILKNDIIKEVKSKVFKIPFALCTLPFAKAYSKQNQKRSAQPMTITLTTFTPGTKAKADEVNANFSILKDAVNSKAPIDGDSTQTFSVADAIIGAHAVNKGQLDYLSDDLTAEINKTGMKFCVRSGYTTSGEADLFSYSVLTITPKIGSGFANLKIADYKGIVSTITSASSISMSGKPDGDYNIFITSSGTLYTLNNTIYVQKARPTMLDGDIWLDTSVDPFNCIKYDGTNDNEFLDVPLGRVTIASNTITAIETFTYNQNGYDVNIASFSDKKFDYANPVSKAVSTSYAAESNGLLFIRHANVNDTITVTIDSHSYTLGWSSSQGSGSSNFIPITKGQTYSFSGGEARYFIPEIDA